MKFAVLGGLILLSDIYASANTSTRDSLNSRLAESAAERPSLKNTQQ